jgi:Fe-S-cluster containining protein
LNSTEVVTAARLEGVYGVLRKIQAEHNNFDTKCVGSGNCCKVGLYISLAECWNIARNLRREYWIKAEDQGKAEAEHWYQTIVNELKLALENEEWTQESQELSTYCVFYKDGCTIYEYRPLVCRAYGVTSPVQEDVCPRKRLPDGGHELIWDETVEKTIAEFDAVVKEWGEKNPTLNFSLYMPAGVLRFLLPMEELQHLLKTTDQKFWMATPGYGHQIRRENWTETSVTIGAKT